MIFEKKMITRVYTVRRCQSCKKETGAEFEPGDRLFAESACPCGSTAMIEKIFCRTMPAS